MQRLDIEHVKTVGSGRFPDVYSYYGVTMNRGTGHILCPFPSHADRNPSFRIEPATGRYYCSCSSGDVFDFVERMVGCDTSTAIKEVAGVVGIECDHAGKYQVSEAQLAAAREAQAKREQELAADRAKRQQGAKAMWQKSQPIAGTLAEQYLRGRAITIPLPATLRFLPSCKHSNGNHYPAMIANLKGSDGQGMAIQRTYLSSDGKKADLGHLAKVSYGNQKTSSVWLGDIPGDGRVVIGEGVESVLSAMQLAGVASGLACLSTSGLRGVALPPGIGEVAICADRDANNAGQQAASDLANRLKRENPALVVAVNIPPAGYGDFNDYLQQNGRADHAA